MLIEERILPEQRRLQLHLCIRNTTPSPDESFLGLDRMANCDVSATLAFSVVFCAVTHKITHKGTLVTAVAREIS